MEWVETTGKSVEEAKELALDRLGVDEADAEFEILEEPKPGLFGRMRGEARLRARVRPTSPRPKQERRRRRVEPEAAAEGASLEVGREPATREVHAMAAPVGEGDDDRDLAQEAGAFLAGLAQAFGASGQVRTTTGADGAAEVHLDGDQLGLLIGPRGQTLQIVQDLTRIVVQRRVPASRQRLRIDIGSYREKRQEALARFARQVAQQVAASGEARALEPMSAADRKVVHDALGGIEGIVTLSEGEDPHRRVVVRPS
ncbi:MAG: RNA-binding cell elongation regulator Jag/EloR [Acidimicrobiales bacterium]